MFTLPLNDSTARTHEIIILLVTLLHTKNGNQDSASAAPEATLTVVGAQMWGSHTPIHRTPTPPLCC